MTITDSRVTPLHLDVTSTEQVQAAAGQVESLDMLINNAGIAVPDDLTDPARGGSARQPVGSRVAA